MNFIEQYRSQILGLLGLASYKRTVKNFGNGAHVTVPKEFLGKKVLVTIL